MVSQFFGDKYNELVEFAPAAELAGLHIPPMVPIEQATIDDHLLASSLPTISEADSAEIEDHEIYGGLRVSDDLLDELASRARELEAVFGGPLILRSSARGDATGNGVYRSVVSSPDPEVIKRALAWSVGSYFSEEAIIFRSRAGLESGFAAFIQPMVGKMHNAFQEGHEERKAKLFSTRLSGNARLGTPRYPDGWMRLQAGLGCAVDLSEAPGFVFSNTRLDDAEAAFAASEQQINYVSPRDFERSGSNYILEGGDKDWYQGDTYGLEIDRGDVDAKPELHLREEITIGGLKTALASLADTYTASPFYVEFVVNNDNSIWIVQKGDLHIPEQTHTIDSIKPEDVLVDRMNIVAGEGLTSCFKRIVCLTRDDKHELYDFDRSPEAEEGYLLAFNASRSASSRKIDMRKLKNVRAVMTLESMDWSHMSSPEQHLVGYSESIGVPLLSVYDNSSRIWRALNGTGESFRADEEIANRRHTDTLIIRSGDFMVITAPNGAGGVVAEFKQTP